MAKILVIDDSTDLCEMITIVLQNYGHVVMGLSDRFEVESTIANFNPQLVLLDVWHSIRSGREICRDMKTTKRNLAVILMSTNEKLLAGYQTCCADDIITKPFDITDLKYKIEKALLINNQQETYPFLMPFVKGQEQNLM